MKYLRCDNGTEFINADVKNLLSRKGIVFERIKPYTAEQNGFIGGTIAQFRSKSLWPEAVRTAVYIWKRSCSKRNPETTPYELWLGAIESREGFRYDWFRTGAEANWPKEMGRKCTESSSGGL